MVNQFKSLLIKRLCFVFLLSSGIWREQNMLLCVSLMPEMICLLSFQHSHLSLLIFYTLHTKLLQLCLTLCYPMDQSPPGSSVPMDSSLQSSSVRGVHQEKKNTGVGCYALLQGIFPTRGLNPYLLCLLHWQKGSLPTSITWEAHVCILDVCTCVCVCLSPNLSDSLYNSKTLLSYGVCYLKYEQTQDLWK